MVAEAVQTAVEAAGEVAIEDAALLTVVDIVAPIEVQAAALEVKQASEMAVVGEVRMMLCKLTRQSSTAQNIQVVNQPYQLKAA